LEEEDKIVILVHESENDEYTEFTYPPIWEMEHSETFRKKALSEFVDAGDETFVRNLTRWYVKPSCKCPLFPVDVYFLWDDYDWFNFEDDVEEPEQEASEQTCEYKANEWCPYCDTEVELEHDLKVQRCPSCGHWIVPCSICPLTKCTKPCPLERLEMMLNKETL
jgi:DNA-directed RNA polymerase subunit RPC12/RpoP